MTQISGMKRVSLEGCWILDKSREPWSMNRYLEIMNVDPLAIEAHEKGEKEHDTYCTIEFIHWGATVKVTKRSRVNNDLVVELKLGQDYVEYLQPNNRPKRSVAKSDNVGHLCITSSLHTLNGTALVTDVKRLVQESEERSVLVQELTIVNQQTGASHTTIRYFNPYTDIPPHLIPAAASDAAGAAVDG
jgi:hypothetical protein